MYNQPKVNYWLGIDMQKSNKVENNIVISKDSLEVSGHLGPAHGAVKIHIASPCYRSTYSATFVASLVKLLNSWRNTKIGYSFNHLDTSNIELSRNFLITAFYYKLKSCSHILFLDNDMGFDASLINRMIELDESVVGVVAPKREIDLKKLHEEADEPYEKALAKSVNFLMYPSAKDAEDKPGFRQVVACGAGILLISRDCVTRMIQACPEIVDTNVSKYPTFVRHFDTFLTPFRRVHTDTEWYSEDVSFCLRWINKCGGKIYANVDSRVKHVGDLEIETRYEDLFETGDTSTED